MAAKKAANDQAPAEPAKTTGLTPKQEAFACKYVECGNASEAYRESYDAEGMQPESIHVAASRLLNDAKVALRVQELRAAIAEAAKLTVADLLRQLEEARTAALTAETVQASAAAAATMGKAKLLGLDKQTIELTGKDGGPIKTDATITMTPEDAYKAMLNGR
jgi:phage terminase small subunit